MSFEVFNQETVLKEKLITYFFGGRHPEFINTAQAAAIGIPSHVSREISRADSWANYCRIHNGLKNVEFKRFSNTGDGVRTLSFGLEMNDGTKIDEFALVVAELVEGVYSIYPDQMTFEKITNEFEV